MAAGRIKQLLHHWTAGGLCAEDRPVWLGLAEQELLARLEREGGPNVKARAAGGRPVAML
jgi:hypothetical protein